MEKYNIGEKFRETDMQERGFCLKSPPFSSLPPGSLARSSLQAGSQQNGPQSRPSRQSMSRGHCFSSASFTTVCGSRTWLFVRMLHASPCLAGADLSFNKIEQPLLQRVFALSRSEPKMSKAPGSVVDFGAGMDQGETAICQNRGPGDWEL